MRPFLIVCGALAVITAGWLFGIATMAKEAPKPPAERPAGIFVPYVGTAQGFDSKSRACSTRNFAQEYIVKYQESSSRVDYAERGRWAIGLGLAFVADALVWCK